ALLARAERLQQQFSRAVQTPEPCWEPPVDVIESRDAILVYVALPGVPAPSVVVHLEPCGITVTGTRALPASRKARIHRIEIPYGRFERHIALPLHALEPVARELIDGCLILRFTKLGEAR